MADDKSKKPKIDLKARLGKTAVGASAGAAVPLPVPGPSAPGSAPPPPGMTGAGGSNMPAASPSAHPSGIAPPPGMSPGLSPGIPLPPFGRAPAAPASKPSAHAQTIKVEIGEEVHAERKKASKRTALYAVLTALAGIGIGFVVGGAKEKGDSADRAAQGAKALEKEIKEANEKMSALDDKLKAASESLGNKTFPAELSKDLAAINIPFDATHLEGKQVGSLGKTLRPLLGYTLAATDLNQSKDSLKNLLGIAQAPIEKSWKEEKDPAVAFAVIFRGDNKGPVAELVPIKEPFALSKDWPESLTVLKTERTQAGAKQVDKKATRIKTGTKVDLTGGNDPAGVVVDPQSTAAFTTEQLAFKLSKAMLDIREILEGKHDPSDPTHETAGLMKDGEDLASELHKIGLQAR